jgi:cytochrome c
MRIAARRVRLAVSGGLLFLFALSAAVTAQVQSGTDPIRYEGCSDLSADQFRKVAVGSGGLQEPVKMAFLPDGRILVAERRGPVKILAPGGGDPAAAWTRKVFWEKNRTGGKTEDGTLGIAVDPGFADNHWVYVLYSPLDTAVNRLSRFVLRDGLLDTATEKVILDVAVEREHCCHTGGGMGWDAQGNLYLTTGDNTSSDDMFAAINEAPGMSYRDAQRSAANTDDLRGKVLRIRPRALPDDPGPGPAPGPGSTYDIPAGNFRGAFAALWPDAADRDKVRPEIYSMGHRNPYTLFVDRYTGWAYIGEVGPDANVGMAGKGPAKHEEFNLVQGPGNFGWPYFIGNNLAYNDWDYATNAPGPAFIPSAPENTSVNNTGVRRLPPAIGAILSRENNKNGKSTDNVERFAAFQGVTAIGGPVYYYDGRNPNPGKLPPHFDRKWLMTDHSGGFLNLATLSPDGKSVTAVSRVPLPVAAESWSAPFDRPVGMEIGPDGMLYVIEYAAGNFAFSASTRISRLEYTGECRPETPVPPEQSAAARGPGRPALRLLAPVAGGRAVRLPAGVPGFSLHDVRGAELWSYRRADAGREEAVRLPGTLPQGVLQVRLR